MMPLLIIGKNECEFRKGSRQHGAAGSVFVVSMLTMAMAASYLAYMKHQTNNVFGGLLTFYMVATAWATAKRRVGETGILDWVGFLFAFAIALLGVIHGIQTAIGTRPSAAGVPAFMDIFLSSVILLAGLGDLRMLVRGISGRRRIARHLWRMCFGWLLPQVPSFWGNNRRFPHHGVGHLGF